MTIDETVDLLTTCAAYDRRTIGKTDAVAWHAVVGDLPFDMAQQAVFAHYSESREWIMPADVRTRVRRQQRDQAERGRIRQLLDPDAYRREVAQADAAFMRKLAQRTGGKQIKQAPEPYTETEEASGDA
jgi:hypothetical protein